MFDIIMSANTHYNLMDNFGDIFIESTCYQSYPCQHYVTYNGETTQLMADEIINLLRILNYPTPEHFHRYIGTRYAPLN